MRNKTAVLGAVLAVLTIGTVSLAASPSPSSSPAASPLPATTQAQSGSKSTSNATASATTTYSAQVQPGLLTGNVEVHQKTDGTGVVTMQINGLVDKLDVTPSWMVEIDGNTIASARIAYLTGSDVQEAAPDTIRFNLTKDQMSSFEQALQSNGVIIDVSNGYRLDAAEIPAQ